MSRLLVQAMTWSYLELSLKLSLVKSKVTQFRHPKLANSRGVRSKCYFYLLGLFADEENLLGTKAKAILSHAWHPETWCHSIRLLWDLSVNQWEQRITNLLQSQIRALDLDSTWVSRRNTFHFVCVKVPAENATPVRLMDPHQSWYFLSQSEQNIHHRKCVSFSSLTNQRS